MPSTPYAFRLHVHAVSITLKFSCSIFIEWKPKGDSTKILTSRLYPCRDCTSLQINQTLCFQEEMAEGQFGVLAAQQSILSVQLLSKSKPDQPKMVGRRKFDLAEVTKNGLYSTLTELPLEYCSIKATISFSIKFERDSFCTPSPKDLLNAGYFLKVTKPVEREAKRDTGDGVQEEVVKYFSFGEGQNRSRPPREKDFPQMAQDSSQMCRMNSLDQIMLPPNQKMVLEAVSPPTKPLSNRQINEDVEKTFKLLIDPQSRISAQNRSYSTFRINHTDSGPSQGNSSSEKQLPRQQRVVETKQFDKSPFEFEMQRLIAGDEAIDCFENTNSKLSEALRKEEILRDKIEMYENRHSEDQLANEQLRLQLAKERESKGRIQESLAQVILKQSQLRCSFLALEEESKQLTKAIKSQKEVERSLRSEMAELKQLSGRKEQIIGGLTQKVKELEYELQSMEEEVFSLQSGKNKERMDWKQLEGQFEAKVRECQLLRKQLRNKGDDNVLRSVEEALRDISQSRNQQSGRLLDTIKRGRCFAQSESLFLALENKINTLKLDLQKIKASLLSQRQEVSQFIPAEKSLYELELAVESVRRAVK